MTCKIHTEKRHPRICRFCRADESARAPPLCAADSRTRSAWQQLRLRLEDVRQLSAVPPPQERRRSRQGPQKRVLSPRVMAVAMVLCGVLFLPTPADAAHCGSWGVRKICQSGDGDVFTAIVGGSCLRRTYCRYWVRDYEPRVYGYRRDRDEDDVPERANCLWNHPLVRATGDDKLSDNDAKISAQDRWSIEVETRYGTRYSGIDNAERLTTSCVKKVPTSTIEKGQAGLGIRHHVCTIEAVPCPPEKVHEDVAKRRSEKISEDVGRRNDPRWDEPPPRKRWYQRYRRQ